MILRKVSNLNTGDKFFISPEDNLYQVEQIAYVGNDNYEILANRDDCLLLRNIKLHGDDLVRIEAHPVISAENREIWS